MSEQRTGGRDPIAFPPQTGTENGGGRLSGRAKGHLPVRSRSNESSLPEGGGGSGHSNGDVDVHTVLILPKVQRPKSKRVICAGAGRRYRPLVVLRFLYCAMI